MPQDRNRFATDPSSASRYGPSVVRAHRTSHNTRLGLTVLGLLAALVAGTSGAQVSGAVPAVTDSPVAAVSGPGIRDVDFSSVAVPGSVCREALRFSQPSEIPIDRGRSPVLDLARMTQVTVEPDVVYGDLDGDGADEAVVRTSCTFGANGVDETVLVWSLDERGRPVPVAEVGEPDPSVTGELPGRVVDVAVDRGALDVTWTRYADDDPNCCPSLEATVTYDLVDGELVPRDHVAVSAGSGR